MAEAGVEGGGAFARTAPSGRLRGTAALRCTFGGPHDRSLIILGIVVVLIFYVISLYNNLVKLRNRIENAWAQIDVQLKRRWDLIPNLVETVKGYANHEKETLEAVISARNAATTAAGPQESAGAENMLSGALRQLFAVSEAYPELKANTNFLELQEELTGTEGASPTLASTTTTRFSSTTPPLRRSRPW